MCFIWWVGTTQRQCSLFPLGQVASVHFSCSFNYSDSSLTMLRCRETFSCWWVFEKRNMLFWTHYLKNTIYFLCLISGQEITNTLQLFLRDPKALSGQRDFIIPMVTSALRLLPLKCKNFQRKVSRRRPN